MTARSCGVGTDLDDDAIGRFKALVVVAVLLLAAVVLNTLGEPRVAVFARAAEIPKRPIQQGPHLWQGTSLCFECSCEDWDPGDDAEVVEMEYKSLGDLVKVTSHRFYHLGQVTDRASEEVQ